MMTNSIQRGRVRYWGLVVALLLGCVVPGRIWAQAGNDSAALDKVFADWKARRTVLKSARYVLTGTTEYKDKTLPPGNPIRPRRIVLLFDMEHEYFRMESTEDVIVNDTNGPSKFQTRTGTSAFNGEMAQSATHKKTTIGSEDYGADLYLEKLNSPPGVYPQYEELPIFFAHGLVPTVHTEEPKGFHGLSYDPDDFFVNGRQLFRGQSCLIVRTEPKPGIPPIWDEFWINPAQKSAIPRYISFNGDNPWARLDVTWKNMEYGWWPDNWSYTHSAGKQVLRVVRLRVESFEANPLVSKTDFTLPVEPGMKVVVGERPPYGKGLDPRKSASKTYIISPSGSWDEIEAKGFTTLEGKELPPERPWKRIAWISLAVIVGLAVVVYALKRWRGKTALSPNT